MIIIWLTRTSFPTICRVHILPNLNQSSLVYIYIYTYKSYPPEIFHQTSTVLPGGRRLGGALRLSFDQLLGRGVAAAGGGLHRLHGVSHRGGRGEIGEIQEIDGKIWEMHRIYIYIILNEYMMCI